MEWTKDEDKKKVNDPNEFINNFEGKEYYALRTHLGLVSDHAKELIKENNSSNANKVSKHVSDAKNINSEEYLTNLNNEE